MKPTLKINNDVSKKGDRKKKEKKTWRISKEVF